MSRDRIFDCRLGAPLGLPSPAKFGQLPRVNCPGVFRSGTVLVISLCIGVCPPMGWFPLFSSWISDSILST